MLCPPELCRSHKPGSTILELIPGAAQLLGLQTLSTAEWGVLTVPPNPHTSLDAALMGAGAGAAGRTAQRLCLSEKPSSVPITPCAPSPPLAKSQLDASTSERPPQRLSAEQCGESRDPEKPRAEPEACVSPVSEA